MLRAMDKWLAGYLASLLRRPTRLPRPCHLILGIMDHYEPYNPGRKVSPARAAERVAAWEARFPLLADTLHDADGRPFRWSFFYPAEEYDEACLDALTRLTARGYGEVEIHLHHDRDTPHGLTADLTAFRDLLRQRHGLLGSHPDGIPAYAFIHGNWALCNALGDGRHCGVNDELRLLRDTGCYVDMTMPAGASPAQARTVNAIYYASSSPERRRGYDRGVPVTAAPPTDRPVPRPPRGDLMLIQGPLGLDWRRRKWGLLPGLEYGDLAASCPPRPSRLPLWIAPQIHVRGRPDWLFVKLHTHGCKDGNLEMLLGEPMRAFLRHLGEHYNDGERWRLHVVTAREMYNLAKAAEAGAAGDPGAWRDFAIAPPPAAGS